MAFKRMNAKEDVEHGGVLAALALRADEQDAVCLHTVTRIQLAAQVLFCNAQDAFGLNAAPHLFREFLKFDELGVD